MKKQQTKGSKSSNRAHPSQFPQMKDWDTATHRIDALKTFVRELNAMTPAQVKEFADSSAKTKTKFAECGPFYEEGKTNTAYAPWTPQSKVKQIPKKTKFHVFRNGNKADREKRDEQVVLIVNPAGKDAEPLANAQTWRCTYSPYSNSKARRRSK